MRVGRPTPVADARAREVDHAVEGPGASERRARSRIPAAGSHSMFPTRLSAGASAAPGTSTLRTRRVTECPRSVRCRTRAVPIRPDEPATRTSHPGTPGEPARDSAVRTKSAKASGWVRCAPCAAPGISTITEPGMCATSQATVSRWWGSERAAPAEDRRDGELGRSRKAASSSRMAPSSATRAGPSARRSALTLSGRRSHALSPTIRRKNRSAASAGSSPSRSRPRTAGGWVAPEAEPGERWLVRGEREDRSLPPFTHRGAERDDTAVTVSDHHRRPPVDYCEEIVDVTVDRVVDRGDAATGRSRAGRTRRCGGRRAGAPPGRSCSPGRASRGRAPRAGRFSPGPRGGARSRRAGGSLASSKQPGRGPNGSARPADAPHRVPHRALCGLPSAKERPCLFPRPI